jgi:hypothetical protein
VRLRPGLEEIELRLAPAAGQHMPAGPQGEPVPGVETDGRVGAVALLLENQRAAGEVGQRGLAGRIVAGLKPRSDEMGRAGIFEERRYRSVFIRNPVEKTQTA